MSLPNNSSHSTVGEKITVPSTAQSSSSFFSSLANASTTSTSKLLEIPKDVQYMINKYLSADDLGALMRTTSFLRKRLTQSPSHKAIWKRAIEDELGPDADEIVRYANYKDYYTVYLEKRALLRDMSKTPVNSIEMLIARALEYKPRAVPLKFL